MLRAGIERLFRGDNRLGPTVAGLSRTCLQLARTCPHLEPAARLRNTATHRFTQPAVGIVLSALALLTLWHSPPLAADATNEYADSTNDYIDAIMGGGTVVGTECVDGRVVELRSDDAINNFGPDLTLFVKIAGKTLLRKNPLQLGCFQPEENADKVNFRLGAGAVSHPLY